MSSTAMRTDRAGQRYGRLVAVRYVRLPGGNKWECKCDCGAVVLVLGASLGNGNTSSCGCLHREQMSERFRKHGARDRSSPLASEYEIWCGMIKRCENQGSAAFEYYGARGVRVCERWRASFAAFLDDVGRRPSKAHSLDRYPDKNGNYEPGNVRWATAREQAQNTRRNRLLTHDGQTLCISEWARRLGVNEALIRDRINRGWPVARALDVGGRPCA